MVPNIVRLLAGLSVSEVATTRLGVVIILAGQKWITMTTYDLASTGIKRALSCGYYVCIKIPLWTLRTFWKTQVFVLSLPYGCFQCLVCALRRSISALVDPPIRSATQKILQDFLSKQNSEKNRKEIESPSEAVRGAEAFDCGFHSVKNKAELERRIEEEATFAKEEQKLLRMTVSALKYLQRLKGSRVVLNDKFKQILEDLISISRNLSPKTELTESMKEFECNRKSRSMHINSLHKQAGLYKNNTDKRQNGYFDASYTSPRNFASSNEFINGPTLKQASVSDSELVCISMEALQSVIYILNAENFALKRRLKLTNDQLGGFKTTSKCLADKVSDLEIHLGNIKEMLKTTKEERDEMCFKLFALSDIIEEQESLLNDSPRRNNVGPLYSTTLDYLLSDFHGTEEANFDFHPLNTANVF